MSLFLVEKSFDLGSGRHESLAFTIWKEISRSLKEFLFMQSSIGSFDMVIFTELPEPDSHTHSHSDKHFTNGIALATVLLSRSQISFKLADMCLLERESEDYVEGVIIFDFETGCMAGPLSCAEITHGNLR